MKFIILNNTSSLVIVDDADYGKLCLHNWYEKKYFNKSGNYNSYAATDVYTESGKRKNIFMHRLIMNAKSGEEIDHINGNGLDNRNNNLRFCSRKQNLQNQFSRRGKSKYKGVVRRGDTGKWRARITINKKRVHLGDFNSESEAALAYNNAAEKYFKDFANFNKINE